MISKGKGTIKDLWRNFAFAFKGLQSNASATNTAALMTGQIFNDMGRALEQMDKENTLLKKELKAIRKELDALKPKKKIKPMIKSK